MTDISNRYLVSVSDALAACMDEGDWKRFAVLHGYTTRIEHHPRFLRSLSWGDPDYSGHVLDFVREIFENEDWPALDELSNKPQVQRWLKQNANGVLEAWNSRHDPILSAISASLKDVHELADALDLGDYTKRILDALPHDPPLAIGGTKELLEATMRTILDGRSVDEAEKLDFPALTSACFDTLGLTAKSPPKDAVDSRVRKVASRVRDIVLTINELRNEAGTGHGKAAGKEAPIDSVDAEMVASTGMVLAAWLTRKNSS